MPQPRGSNGGIRKELAAGMTTPMLDEGSTAPKIWMLYLGTAQI
jgi:hypothetical protein